MDTNRIKKFAIEARNTLKAGIAGKLTKLGFKKDGTVADNMRPVLLQGGCVWNGATETEGFYHRWMSLYERVQRKGLNEVYEEAAYTWFNRLIAIRILQKNGLAAPVLDFVDIARTPRIVDDARSGQFPQMPAEDKEHLNDLLDDDTKTSEQFALLITAWCQNNPIINSCFGGIKDYTEILLPHDILKENGFVDMINHTEFITDEDFKSPELIGWLYQFYISERKDEVFAKKGKFEADEIPAATQIFTPNWIVKYMVQNTVGRIYLDNHPYSAALKSNWKYLVEGEPTPQESIYRYNELTELKVADLACGSGHILNECFDLLYELYMEEAYSRKEAIKNIFKYNLTGVDLDKRAQQLSKFALLLKACQKDSSFADAHCMPNVLTMPKAWDEDRLGTVEAFIPHFFKGTETKKVIEEISAAYKLMQNADSLGSIMKFDLSDTTRKALSDAVTYWQKESFVPKDILAQMPSMKLILALTEKYSALVMNPPYMKLNNMNDILSSYVKQHYSCAQADLCTVFMLMQSENTSKNCLFANIIPPSWIFLGTFESIRNHIIDKCSIESLLHLSRGVFGADFGSVAVVIKNKQSQEQTGNYFRLVERTFQEFDQKHLKELFENTLANPNFRYKFKDYHKNTSDISYSDNGKQIYYPNVSQKLFKNIPGSPLGYWLNDTVINAYRKDQSKSYIDFKTGITTGDNPRFTRFWMEVSSKRMDIWKFMRSGSTYRKWYGSLLDVVFWENEGELIKSMPNSTMRNPEFQYRPGITWSKISSGDISVRYSPQEVLFDAVGLCGFSTDENLKYGMALYNSKVGNYFIRITNSSMSILTSDLGKIPFIIKGQQDIIRFVDQNIAISQIDWDVHETSWDFQMNELVKLQKEGLGTVTASCGETTAMKYSTLNLLYAEYVAKWEKMFHELHANEEELNRQFIEIYGLQDELTPDVPLDEVTILQQGEIKIENNQILFQRDVVIKQLISYAIGCWMGRYRLDKPGLHIAHPSPTADEICTYSYGNETLTIDDDGNIPLLPYDCPFDDNLQNRIADFVRIAFGADSLTENLNFIEESLGCSIEKYLDKDFWKDHKKMYQNKPIYWLWSSKKGAFRVLSYMHRMDAYTAERIRSKYLLPYIEYVQNKIHNLENKITSLTTTEKRSLDNYRKILEECREYHDRLHVVAEQAIAFDLDDGVTVNYAKFGDVLSKIK